MILKRILFSLILLITFSLSGQEFNKKDSNGLMQGPWRKFHVDSENLFYTGEFKNDKPIGVFTYYYKNGKVKGLMDYSKDLGACYANVFYENGVKMASGKYVGAEKKDSTWTYYSSSDKLKSKDNWKNGLKNGEEVTYFPDGSVAEIIHWKEGKRDGVWEQYFSKDKLMVEGAYSNDAYEGEMTFYFLNGKIEVTGKYVNGLRDGSWYYYNEDGSIYMQTLYNSGSVLKEKKVTGLFQEHTDDGIVISELNYVKGQKNGPFKIYHDGAEWTVQNVFDKTIGESLEKRVITGHQIQMSGTYKDDKMDGIVKHYNKAGVLIKEDKYLAGELVE